MSAPKFTYTVARGLVLWCCVPFIFLRDICAAFVNPVTNRDPQ